MSTFNAIAPRPAPQSNSGAVAWCKANLFHDWKTSTGTLLIGLILLWLLPRLFHWAITDAVWYGNYETCHAASGACWAAIRAASFSTSLSRFFRSAGQPACASNLGLVVGNKSITTR